MKKLLILFTTLLLMTGIPLLAQNTQLALNQTNGTTAAVQWNGSGAFVTVGGTFGGGSVTVQFSPNNSDFYALTGLSSLTSATQGAYELSYGWYRVVVAGGSSPSIDVYFSLYKGPSMTTATTTDGTRWSSGALVASAAAGGVFTWTNSTGSTVLVTDVIIELTTAATAAATLNVGFAATVVASDTLIDGLDVNAATGTFSNNTSPGTNGLPADQVPAGQYVTASQATGDVTGIVGTYHIGYHIVQ